MEKQGKALYAGRSPHDRPAPPQLLFADSRGMYEQQAPRLVLRRVSHPASRCVEGLSGADRPLGFRRRYDISNPDQSRPARPPPDSHPRTSFSPQLFFSIQQINMSTDCADGSCPPPETFVGSETSGASTFSIELSAVTLEDSPGDHQSTLASRSPLLGWCSISDKL